MYQENFRCWQYTNISHSAKGSVSFCGRDKGISRTSTRAGQVEWKIHTGVTWLSSSNEDNWIVCKRRCQCL